MSITIRTNVASLGAQRRLAEGTSKLNSTFERLSSGLRINRASDDAAGLGIATTLDSNARVLTQGIKNASDGISLLNIADGVFGELSSIAIRIAELAEQSANGVFSARQRSSLDEEAQALAQEFKRIGESAEFNGMKLLDGSISSFDFQVGGSGSVNSRIVVEDFSAGATQTAGDGTFQNPTSLNQAGASALGSGVGDVNGDGHLDIVVSPGSGASDINTYFGNGDGTFNVVTQGVVSSIRISDLEDLDGDGRLDIVGTTAGVATVRFGDGAGGWSAGVSLGIASERFGETGDVDGDGDLDIIAIDDASNQVRIFRNNGDRTFTALATLSSTNLQDAHFGDFDQDGTLDILSRRTGFLDVYTGNGDGTFSLASSQAFAVSGGSSIVGDLNNDGIPDFVYARSSGPTLDVFLGQSNGTLASAIAYAYGEDGGGTNEAIGLEDVNEDGNVDVVLRAGTGADLNVLLGDGNGSISSESRVPDAATALTGVNFGDFNEDGAIDIIATSISDPEASIYFANAVTVAGLAPFDLNTQADARSALDLMKATLDQLSVSRGLVGVAQSRIANVVSNNHQAVENLRAAASRILDADIAAEATALVNQNIQQQAAIAVLTQANQLPALALGLLAGI